MADEAQPLTVEERAELEALRAEKAARLEREKAERERAELERLRAERAQAQAAPAQQAAAKTAAPAAAARRGAADAAEERRIREARERGEKLMMPDDDLRMPMGQKIVLATIAVLIILAVIMHLAVR